MDMLSHLLQADPAAPRLTVYTESTGARMDFSAQTLENWTAKIANLLAEELDIEPGDGIIINLPVSWQAVVIALGALARGAEFYFPEDATGDDAGDAASGEEPAAVFTAPELFSSAAERYPGADILLVTDDPFGRGVAETGGEVPLGAIDFGPTVRFYGDIYAEPTEPLPALVPAAHPEPGERLLSTGWSHRSQFTERVLAPLAAGGSVVVVAGPASQERLADIAAAERTTAVST